MSTDPDKYRGLYSKFDVRRTNAEAQARHPSCKYFVLDYTHDRFAPAAMEAYAHACEESFPRLAADLRVAARAARIDNAEGTSKETSP